MLAKYVAAVMGIAQPLLPEQPVKNELLMPANEKPLQLSVRFTDSINTRFAEMLSL